jgi:hypothetical protein
VVFEGKDLAIGSTLSGVVSCLLAMGAAPRVLATGPLDTFDQRALFIVQSINRGTIANALLQRGSMNLKNETVGKMTSKKLGVQRLYESPAR